MKDSESVFTAGAKESGRRLDVVVCAYLGEEVSRRAARKLCEDGIVLVNGAPAAPGSMLKAGDTIQVLRAAVPVRARPEAGERANFSVEVLYEDEHLVVVAKPRGVHSVTQRPEDPATLADWLAYRFPRCQSASADPREAGLVQRLDFYTSGAMIAAKSADAWVKLHALIAAGGLDKSYLGLIEGVPQAEHWSADLPLRAISGGKKVAVLSLASAKWPSKILPAETSFVCLKKFHSELIGREVALVRAVAAAARRHQVRAHLAASAHPLIGDTLYGSAFDAFPYEAPGKERQLVPGFFLHAERLSFPHPFTAAAVEVSAAEALFPCP